jgi:hypothetical protein
MAMFAAVAMAWDNDHSRNRLIHGEYYFVGAGPCVLAPGGFNGILQPNTGESGPWNMSDSTWEGVYKFNYDGTGMMEAIFRVVERPSDVWFSGPGSDIPDAGAANVSWKFNYTVSEIGRIKFIYIRFVFSSLRLRPAGRYPDISGCFEAMVWSIIAG